ncbi:MAG: G5 domain-containing protein [Eubacteriaceae bacterium]
MEEKQISPSKRKHSKFKIGIIGLITICVIGVSSSFAFAKEVKVLVDGTETHVRGSLFQNVEEVLSANGIKVGDDYTLSVDAQKKLVEVNNVVVSKKSMGNIMVDGGTIAYKTEAKTIGELLKENGITLEELDRVEPSKGTALADVSEVKVVRVKIEEIGSQKEIPFDKISIENSDLEVGSSVVSQAGAVGINSVVERIMVENGVEVKREVIKDEVVSAPVNEVTEIGTLIPVVEEPPVVVPPPVVETPEPAPEQAPAPTPESTPVVEEVVANSNFVPNPEGSGVERWRGHVARALSELGLDTSNDTINRVLRQIDYESGGNPNAINDWDSNARAGNPSQGLLQTIPTTFLAYCRGGDTLSDITNGYANIYAGIHYCADRYGRTLPVWPTRGGY